MYRCPGCDAPAVNAACACFDHGMGHYVVPKKEAPPPPDDVDPISLKQRVNIASGEDVYIMEVA